MRAVGELGAGAFVALFLGWSAAPQRVAAEMLDTNFSEVLWVETLPSATGMAWAPDGSNRLFIAIKEGNVRVVENRALRAAPFATENVRTENECGVIGIAFDPNYVENRFVYLFITVSASEQRIVRYTDADSVGTARREIVTGLPTRGENHNGGAIGFGPDGKLYWAIGDNGNGSGVNADLGSLAAKVARSNRDGSVPNDNPFFDGPGPNEDLIWARGFRNPFTFSFRPATGQLWVNSVGTDYEQVFVVGPGDHAGYNRFEDNQPADFLSPVIAYGTNGSIVRPIVAAAGGASRARGSVTYTTTEPHGYRLGTRVTIDGVSDSAFDGEFFVRAVPTPDSFKVAQALPDALAGGGTASSLDIGGSITGGTFWDSSAPVPVFRGNYYFADYNSGRISRAALNDDGEVYRLVPFATGITNALDVSVGPDGGLYYMGIDGKIFRAAPTGPPQGIVVTPLHVRMDEGGAAVLSVRLGTVPSRDYTVTAALSGGDSDVTIAGADSVTFTRENWARPQRFELRAARDDGPDDDLATIRLSSDGLSAETVEVAVTDIGAPGLVISRGFLEISEEETASFDVRLAAAPAAPVEIQVGASGDSGLSVSAGAALDFDSSNWNQPQRVEISAAADDDKDDERGLLTLTGRGFAARTVRVEVSDDDTRAPEFTSTPPARAVVDIPFIYLAAARGRPTPRYALTRSPLGMSVDAESGLVSWTPTDTGHYPIALEAGNGIEPAASQSFELEVLPDAAPTCVLTKPRDGDTLSGARAEFFGDVRDDVGAVRAEFYVDGELEFTDEQPSGHYHFGGSHNQFDSTRLSDGEHQLRISGRDTAGQTCAGMVDITVDNSAERLATLSATLSAPHAAIGRDASSLEQGSPAPERGGHDLCSTSAGSKGSGVGMSVAGLALCALALMRRRSRGSRSLRAP